MIERVNFTVNYVEVASKHEGFCGVALPIGISMTQLLRQVNTQLNDYSSVAVLKDPKDVCNKYCSKIEGILLVLEYKVPSTLEVQRFGYFAPLSWQPDQLIHFLSEALESECPYHYEWTNMLEILNEFNAAKKA